MAKQKDRPHWQRIDRGSTPIFVAVADGGYDLVRVVQQARRKLKATLKADDKAGKPIDTITWQRQFGRLFRIEEQAKDPRQEFIFLLPQDGELLDFTQMPPAAA